MPGYDFPPADNGQPQVKPSLGSILSRHRGANNSRTGLPTYVRLQGTHGDGPAWLGAPYAPFDTAGEARNNMNLNLTMQRLSDRRAPPTKISTPRPPVGQSRLMSGRHTIPGQAL